ncbi:MAG: hypothetical protein QM529_00635 [Hydrotalea sp.]|nr:hypothetical protein [Hydrotalea sp.]
MAKKKTSLTSKRVARPNPRTPVSDGRNEVPESLFTDIHYAAWADKILKLYRRYQWWLWMAVASGLLLAMSALGFGYYQGKTSQKVSEEFYTLLTTQTTNTNAPSKSKDKVAANPANAAALVDFATQYEHGAGAGYGALAAVMASQLLEKTPDANLQKKLDEAMAKNSRLKNLVALRTADEKTLRSMVVSATSGGSGQNLAFVNLALADRLTANGKKDEAKKILQTLALNNQNNLLGLLVIQFLPAY